MAGVDVMQMDRRRVGGPLPPQVRDGAREQPQHAVHPLEVVECRGLAGQRVEDVRVQRVARPELLHRLGPRGVVGHRVLVAGPQSAVGVDHLGRLGVVDVLEQTPPEHLHGLVLFGRVQQSRLPRRDALDLGHPVRDELVLR